jgi:hypothetical protein
MNRVGLGLLVIVALGCKSEEGNDGGGAGMAAPLAGASGSAVAGAGAGGAGAGGMGGAGAGGTGDVSAQECIDAVMAAGTTVTACEMCLCQPGNCQAELMAIDGDADANAMLMCVRENNCDGQCCLCGAPCMSLGQNYAMGPCAMEIEQAAGVTPGAGALTNGSMVMMACATEGPADNSCANVSRIGQCVKDKCMTECTQAPACQ